MNSLGSGQGSTTVCCSSCRKGNKPGIVHIFNQRIFEEKLKLDERIGTEFDVKALEQTFQNFDVKTVAHENLKLKQIRREIKRIQSTDFSENSCIVIVFLTHGFEKNVIAANDKLYCCDEIILQIQSIESLISKPKIFLIQACRNGRSNRLYSEFVKSNYKKEPKYLNETIVVNSSTEFLPSYRSMFKGTPFIQVFCNILNEFGSKITINVIFDLVTIAVQKRCNQSPEIKKNTATPYTFGDYCKNIKETKNQSSQNPKLILNLLNEEDQHNKIINNMPEMNGNECSSKIENLSELELSDDDNENVHLAPIQKIIEDVSEIIDFAKENDQITINAKAEEYIDKVKSEDVDKWVKLCPCGHTALPDNPVLGGTDIDGEPIYIGRAIWNYELLPAKVNLQRKHAFVSYNFSEFKTTDFEILTGTGYSWVADKRGSVPLNAVLGGKTIDGENLYIGRTAHDTTITPGKIHPSHGFLYIPFDGREIRFFHYEVLVKSSS